MSFGQTIKTLRHNSNMTQEDLAELLSISPQAVSRWETDAAMPDISLLPPLANLFNVTTDHLLGMETYQKDARKAEYDEAFHEYWNHDDKEKNYRIAVRAAAEYPGNMEYMEWLASAEYYIGVPNPDDEMRNQLLESSARHYKIVIANSGDHKLRSKALSGIVMTLHELGLISEAKEYAMRLENEDDRDEILCWCLEGEDRITHVQKTAVNLLNRFLFQLRSAGRSLERCSAIEQILLILFPDKNYQYYHNTLQYNAIDKAFLLCNEGRFDDAVSELRKAKFHAGEMVKYGKEKRYCFTAPLFDHVSGDKMETDSDITDIDDFIRCLNNNTCFDKLREREDFKALYI